MQVNELKLLIIKCMTQKRSFYKAKKSSWHQGMPLNIHPVWMKPLLKNAGKKSIEKKEELFKG